MLNNHLRKARGAGSMLVYLLVSQRSVHTHATPLLALRLPLQRLGTLYSSALAKNPVLTNCIQAAAISGVSDTNDDKQTPI